MSKKPAQPERGHGHLLNRLAVIPRALGIREADAERKERHGTVKPDAVRTELRALSARVDELEARLLP